MKKKFKIVVGLMILIAAAYLYAHIDKTTIIYNEDLDSSEYKNTGVLINKSIEQSFVCSEDVLDGMRVKCGVLGDVSGVQLKYSLINMKTKKLEAESIVDAAEIKNSKFFDLRFDQISGCKGKSYQVIIEAVGAATDKGFNLFFTPGIEKHTNLFVGTDNIDGTLVLKTLSHRFDLETFTVVLFFALYIILFLKFLYKLFR
ncbi:MAG: hypothetical protein RSD97_00695 [Lachnospiraceae bacterium]